LGAVDGEGAVMLLSPHHDVSPGQLIA
jgi:hypothetical protein